MYVNQPKTCFNLPDWIHYPNTFRWSTCITFLHANIKQMLCEKSNANLFITYWPKSALGDYKRFDFVEELLSHNLVHVVEMIFEYVGFPYTWSCIQVNHLWHDFLSHHFFPRWADQMMNHDMSLCEIYEPEEIESMSAGKIF